MVRVVLWEVLKEYAVNSWLLKAIKAIYEGSKVSVRLNVQLSDLFDIRQDFRYGCVTFSRFFNIQGVHNL